MDKITSIYIISVILFLLRTIFQFYILYRFYLFIKGFEEFTRGYLSLQDKILDKENDRNDVT